VSQTVFQGDYFLEKFVELCEMCCRIACTVVQSNVKGDMLL